MELPGTESRTEFGCRIGRTTPRVIEKPKCKNCGWPIHQVTEIENGNSPYCLIGMWKHDSFEGNEYTYFSCQTGGGLAEKTDEPIESPLPPPIKPSLPEGMGNREFIGQSEYREEDWIG